LPDWATDAVRRRAIASRTSTPTRTPPTPTPTTTAQRPAAATTRELGGARVNA